MFNFVVLIALSCSFATAFHSPSHAHSNRGLSFNPPLRLLGARSGAHKHILGNGKRHVHQQHVPDSWTNAQRLSMGLPIKPPTKDKHVAGLPSPSPRPPCNQCTHPTPTESPCHTSSPTLTPSAPPSSIPSDPPSSISSDPPSSVPPSSAEPSTPTPTPSDPTEPSEPPVIFTRGSFSCGRGFYISQDLNSFGQYTRTTDPTRSLVLDIDMIAAQLGPVSMTTVNGSPTFPRLSALNGWANVNADLGPGTYHYAYIGGSTDTPPGSPAVVQPNSFSAAAGTPVGVQSSIWRYSPGSGVTPHWINSDGSEAETELVYVPAALAFALVGDVAIFEANFGATEPCTLTFIPDTISAPIR
ncbi:hypothetical protein CCMSSC00406_0006309 [Pleurotus cornucopiae]|uniref:Uncharacterized protein n=1 Tax=Pleurotus cornucopiae TaxID=5321 RepID=A0ACB7IPX4_PLECO|nr:hypothetical protein CCMSSC00406_0006309 [Pleurotus cornucopiae]